MKLVTLAILLAAGLVLCTPVAADYASLLQSGSSFDRSQGSFSSGIGANFVGTNPSVSYDTVVNGIGSAPAIGNAKAYLNGNFMDSSTISGLTSKYISYHQKVTVSGKIYEFQFSAHYHSGMFF